MTMASPSPPQSAPPAPCWPFQRMSCRVSVLSLSVAFGVLSYAATGAAQSKPGMSRFFTARALRRVGPAVVRIDKVHIEPIGGSLAPAPDDRPDSDPFFPDPFFQQFFNQRRHQRVIRGLGKPDSPAAPPQVPATVKPVMLPDDPHPPAYHGLLLPLQAFLDPWPRCCGVSPAGALHPYNAVC